MQIRSSFFIFFLSIMEVTFINAQEITQDSLIQLDYKEIRKSLITNADDSITAMKYANAYIVKAKRERDTSQMVKGYYFKIILDTKKETSFHLYDTIIELSKNLKNENFPATAYFDKGVIYHRKYLYKNALDNYIQASKYNNGSRKEHLEFLINQSLSLLKSNIDKDEEALTLAKSCYKYVIEQNFKEENSPLYYNVLYSLTNAYRKMNYIDSARVYNRLGLLDKNTSNNSINYNHFLMLDGVLKFYTGEYAEAEINILKSLPQIEQIFDQNSLALGYYYLGKTYLGLKKKPEAIQNFKKVDSVYQHTDYIVAELTNAYLEIIQYYKENNSIEDQLKYTEKLIKVDQVLANRYKYLSEEIIDKLDIPKLISSKEALIVQLKSDKKKSKTYSIVLITILASIIGIAIYQFRKKSFYKKRFKELIHNTPKKRVSVEVSETIIPDVPEDIVKEILNKLSVFEEKHNYVDSKITLHSLASKMNTNSNYLSKVINNSKQKSFTSYIKQLRVNYAFNRLKTEDKLRKFTIKAIAEECGFKSAESFSKTFYKIYEIYPSFFIKQLNKAK
ncbi:MAG: AraC-like DNA-binding protein [Dokdonia sp.]|jgi:AraC-like DNA-binding protein